MTTVCVLPRFFFKFQRHTHRGGVNASAFAAVKEDGSVVTWRHADFGGNSDKVKSELQGIVFKVKANLPA